MAPEIWEGHSYNKPVDIWSCGIIMYNLLTQGKHPYWNNKDNEYAYMSKL